MDCIITHMDDWFFWLDTTNFDLVFFCQDDDDDPREIKVNT